MADNLPHPHVEAASLKPEIEYGAWVTRSNGEKKMIARIPHESFIALLEQQLQIHGGDVRAALGVPRRLVKGHVARGAK